MKLKTVKELVVSDPEYKGVVLISDLRQEAIKIVKYKRAEVKKMFPELTLDGLRMQGKDLIDFFNLTEEDLKGKDNWKDKILYMKNKK